MNYFCIIDWNLILEYVRVLIWPLILVGILIIYRRPFGKLINRIANELISFNVLGTSVTLSVKDVQEISNISKDKNDLAEKLIEYIRELTSDELDRLATVFNDSNQTTRAKIENQIYLTTKDYPFEDIKLRIPSDTFTDKLIALIGIRAHFETDMITKDHDETVEKYLIKSLSDESSLIRYRAAKAIYLSDYLCKKYIDKIEEQGQNEGNKAVMRLLKLIKIKTVE